MKSNKFLLAIAAMAAVSMSSCSQEEELVVPDNQLSDNAVVFGTYIGASRATVMDLTALQSKGFGVMAYYTGEYEFGKAPTTADPQTPNFMYNQQVTYTDGAWTYTPLKYWPNNANDKVSFFAYAPYTSKFETTGITSLSTNATAGDPTLSFVMDADVSKQIDLLYADAVTDQTKSALTDGKVSMKFNHALSRISFSRLLEIDEPDNGLQENTTVTINSVTFSALKFGTKGTLNLNTGVWDVTESIDKKYVLEYKTNEEGKNIGNLINNVLTGNVGMTSAPLTNEESNIMFIPVDLTATGTTAKGEITINYTVETTDTNLKGGKSVVTNNITVDVPAINFLPGYAYNFVLKIGLTSVKLDAQVAKWEDGTISNWNSIVF